MKQVVYVPTVVITASLILGLSATFTLLPDQAVAQDEQVTGVDFAVSKENLPEKPPIYSPYVGQSHPDVGHGLSGDGSA